MLKSRDFTGSQRCHPNRNKESEEFCSLRISFVERMGNGDASISSSVIPEEFAKGAETR